MCTNYKCNINLMFNHKINMFLQMFKYCDFCRHCTCVYYLFFCFVEMESWVIVIGTIR